MTVQSVQIVSVPVSHQDKAKDFYAETLGFQVVVDQAVGPGRRFVQLAPPAGGATLALIAKEGLSPVRGLVFETDDIDADVKDLQACGVSFPSGVQDMPWARVATFADPDGNQLALQSPVRTPG